MRHNLTGLYYRFVFIFCVIFLTNPVLAQNNEDPESNIDAIPRGFKIAYPTEQLATTVITVDGYDNFYLGTASAEPHMSVNPKNPLQFFNAFNINTAFRTSDGLEWFQSTPNFGTSVNGDPVTAYDSLGNLYYESMFGGITGCKVIRSTDNGATWSSAVTAISGRDKNWIAADQTSGPYANYVYTTMTGPSTGSVGNFARSTDFGVTWTQTASFNTQVLPGMMVAVGPSVGTTDIPGGKVYVVTHSGTNALGTYNFYVSTNGGLNFAFKSSQQFSNVIGTEISGRSTVNGMRTRPYPFIAADNSYGPYRGRLYLVYASNSPAGSGNKPDVFCRYSTDDGATWSAPVTINDDVNKAANHSFFPAIWCDKTSGRLFVKWYDSRLCPTSDSMDVYASYSDDGGVTFAPNVRISNQTFKTKISGSGSAPAYQGDYDAITAINNQSMLVWTDFRYNNYASFVGYFPDFALTATPASQTILNNNDSTTFSLNVPSVKAYNSTVKFTASITPNPTQGTLSVIWPAGDVLSTYPGNIPLRIKATGNVTPGNYTVTIMGAGPYGTPVHKRTVTLVVNNDIPVELTSFTAQSIESGIQLTWETATETNNRGFEIERSIIQEGKDLEWQPVGFVAGFGTTTESHMYNFTDDNNLSAGNYAYRLRQIDFDGSFVYTQHIEIATAERIGFRLEQNYPNPFNPATTIKFSNPVKQLVTLRVYSLLGEQITELVNRELEAGYYSFDFRADNLPSGIYIYQLSAPSMKISKKMTLTK